MPKIELSLEIHANIELCFDLARSIDLHVLSTTSSRETAIVGVTTGLIQLHDTVTWQATHLGIRQKFTSHITALERPYYFKDEQLQGIFKSLKHEHFFIEKAGKVVMKDLFEFQSPLGILGILFNHLFLTRYLKNFLIHRNNVIKLYAESDKWKTILNGK